MASSWKVALEQRLKQAETPSVLTTGMLLGIARSARPVEEVSDSAFFRWLRMASEAGKLREITKGVYLNVLGHRDVSPAAAATLIRSRSVVDLSWVLEQAGLTNNLGETYTCVIPTDPAWPNPNLSDRVTAAGTFRFFAMPARLVDEEAGALEDVRDLRFDYVRATPEKAFLDWIYLGTSGRSRLTLPPLDIDYDELDAERLHRLAQNMALPKKLEAWVQRYRAYQADEDVQANAAGRLNF
ncbi:MAG: hypothetical protein V4731_06890 [Pseudomonadota bacterium]